MSKAHPRFRRNNPALPPALPNLFEVLVVGECEGANPVNTFFYGDGNATLSPASESNVASGWQTAFQTHYLAAISADYILSYIKVQCLNIPTRIPFKLPVGVIGSGPVGHEPMTVGATIQRLSAIKGQAGRGRITMPAVPSAWVTDSILTTVLAHNAVRGDLATAFVSAGVTYTPQVVSRGNRAGPPLGASPVLQSILDSVLGSARRRKINR